MITVLVVIGMVNQKGTDTHCTELAATYLYSLQNNLGLPEESSIGVLSGSSF